MVDSLVLFLIVLVICGLVGVIAMLLHAYFGVQKKLSILTRQNQYLKNQGLTESEQILSGAHKDALLIIDAANKKAAEILSQIKTIDTQNQGVLHKKIDETQNLHAEELKKTSDALLALYKDALQTIQKNDINLASTITKDIEKGAQGEIAKFRDVLARETIQSEKAVEGKLQEEYRELEGELKAYKDSRLKEIDSEILQIVQTVTESILHKQLSADDQRQLVLESLIEAKKHTQSRI